MIVLVGLKTSSILDRLLSLFGEFTCVESMSSRKTCQNRGIYFHFLNTLNSLKLWEDCVFLYFFFPIVNHPRIEVWKHAQTKDEGLQPGLFLVLIIVVIMVVETILVETLVKQKFWIRNYGLP